MKTSINDLMNDSGVAFGTSGARGLVQEMTDKVCYAYTKGFIQYLVETGTIKPTGGAIAIAGDLRSSTNRIMAAISQAITDHDHQAINCGHIPSPAVALYGLINELPAIMVTGSHIPDDRNGIKFNKPSGEILKNDETGIKRQIVEINDELFDGDGAFKWPAVLAPEDTRAGNTYVDRFLDVFPPDCLAGKTIGIYQHSAVGRDHLARVFRGLGAEIILLGFSHAFMPVDTEAIREEDVALALKWSAQYELDAIVSTDGDSDRPLISDENGKWLRGDIVGILASAYLDADAVSTPVSCNTAVEKCGWFTDVRRTRIGSPHVIESMQKCSEANYRTVVGYEANGGFLLNNDVLVGGHTLQALPTRDALLPILAVLLLGLRFRCSISQLVEKLPARVTLSGRIQNFPVAQSNLMMKKFGDRSILESVFSPLFGKIEATNNIDGTRIIFSSGDILHFRPSGNAPEFRCYSEAESTERAAEILEQALDIVSALAVEWRSGQ
jgi:phosphomannomutase